MMALSTNTVNYPNRFSLPNTELFSIPDEEDEDDLNDTTEFENLEKELSSILATDAWISQQSRRDFSMMRRSIQPKKSRSRSYKYVQLERTLTLANLLKNRDDRIKFEHDYRNALHENKFEEFLKIYYQKLGDENEKIRQENILKQTRTFTFVDLEKNFLALDPTHDLKIVFVDDHATSKKTYIKQIQTNDDDAIETFYENRSRRLLRNPSHARNEITLFARRSGEQLYERLPHLTRVPHRIKIVDERDKKGIFDENTLLQLKHKHNLSLITKRRQLIMKMMLQTKKNQLKMEQLNIRSPLIINNSSSCRELLEQMNQIEEIVKKEQFKRPQTAGFISRRTMSKTTNYSSTQTTITTESITPSFSSCSIPFQDALSIYHVEKTNNVHVILPKRPLTAPIKKMSWINYC